MRGLSQIRIDSSQTRTKMENLTGVIKMNVDVKQLARGKWPNILVGMGIESRFLSKKNGPCPVCGGKDRFRFSDFNGDGLYYCTGCGPGDGFALAEKALKKSFLEVKDFIMKNAGVMDSVTTDHDKKADLRKMVNFWGKGRKVQPDNLVGKYLSGRLGMLPFGLLNIRQNGDLMIARVTDKDGNGCNVHRTYLEERPDGSVINTDRKVMAGELPKGCAIRLHEPTKVLGVAEGIETALSAHLMFGVPVWSVISTVGMVNWTPPETVETVVIYGDNDENYAGQAAAYQLANKLVARHKLKVEVRIPPVAGWDWNDALKRRPQSA